MGEKEGYMEKAAGRFVSATVDGSGNQNCFCPASPEMPVTGRVFYRLFMGGTYAFSALFSDGMDTTYGAGGFSRAGQKLGGWRIISARMGVAARAEPAAFDEPGCMQAVTFDGKTGRVVAPGDVFRSDPVRLNGKKGGWLCLETTVQGVRIPCHPETLLPSFARTDRGWVPSSNVLFAGQIGCDRPAALRIGFLGDSITQGIGTAPHACQHWCARLAERLGQKNAYWNLGLGFARASDAALNGTWMDKARQNDGVFLCLGVNDLLQGASAETVLRDLEKTVELLHEAGTAVFLQTVPPFDYEGEARAAWLRVNEVLRGVLAGKTEGFFDNVPVLCADDDAPWRARYGGHPNAEGCAAWAAALEEKARRFLDCVKRKPSCKEEKLCDINASGGDLRQPSGA